MAVFTKCLIIVLISMLSFYGPGCYSWASTTTEKHSAGHNQAKPDQPIFMWKISNGKNTSYLLGSIHMVQPDFYPLPSEMEKAFQKSAVLVLEIDESKTDPTQLQQLMMRKGMYGDGDVLRNHLSKDTNAELTRYMQSNAAMPNMMVMRPWLASVMIPVLELKNLGLDPELGIDKHFFKEATASKKMVDQLETAEFQMKLFAGFSDELQDKLLLASLLEVHDIKKYIAEMMAAWKHGSANEMDTLLSRESKEHPELEELDEQVIYKRNETMANKIDAFMQTDKQYFVVVGAAHIVGPRGIVKMLQDKGYKVEQCVGVSTQSSH